MTNLTWRLPPNPQLEQLHALQVAYDHLDGNEPFDDPNEYRVSQTLSYDLMRAAAKVAGIEKTRIFYANLITPTYTTPAQRAVRAAAWALACRHLIDNEVFRQRHYDTLTAPWVAVMGPIHPDDQSKETAA